MRLNNSTKINIKFAIYLWFGSKKRKVLFNDKKSQRRQGMESLTTLQVLVETFHEQQDSFVI